MVGEAADGHEAIVCARTEGPDVIVMDVSMRGLNGIDATARIVIPNELRGVRFEPFRRVNVRSRERHGLGLGLYITKQLVLAHGGSVSFESSTEAGTCFLVTMPRHCRDGGAS